MPGSTSISTWIGRRRRGAQFAERRQHDRPRSGSRRAPAPARAARAAWAAPAIGEVTRIAPTPAAAMASASASLAQQIPTAPAAIWRCARAEHLCDLACGRSARPAALARAAIFATLRSKASRSRTAAGVGIAAPRARLADQARRRRRGSPSGAHEARHPALVGGAQALEGEAERPRRGEGVAAGLADDGGRHAGGLARRPAGRRRRGAATR